MKFYAQQGQVKQSRIEQPNLGLIYDTVQKVTPQSSSKKSCMVTGHSEC